MHVLSLLLHTKAIAVVTVAGMLAKEDIGEKSKFCLKSGTFAMENLCKKKDCEREKLVVLSTNVLGICGGPSSLRTVSNF